MFEDFSRICVENSSCIKEWQQYSQSHWPSDQRRGSAADRWLGLRVRIPPGAWVSVSCECCVLWGLRRAYHSSRGVLPTVVCHCVWSRNLRNEAAVVRVGLLRRERIYKNNEYSTWRRSTFIVMHRLILRMRNVSDKKFKENQNTFYVRETPSPRKSCHLWANVEKYGRGGQNTYGNIIRRMRFARWVA